jgi:hypothetical protein
MTTTDLAAAIDAAIAICDREIKEAKAAAAAALGVTARTEKQAQVDKLEAIRAKLLDAYTTL